MEDWNHTDTDQENPEGMDTGPAPAPPPRIQFGSWTAKPTTSDKKEDQGTSMVSHSYYKPINGYFPTFSSLLGCTTPSDHTDHHSDRRAPQCARDRPVENVNKSENITGPTRQRPGGRTDSLKPAKTASSRHVAPSKFAASPSASQRGACADRDGLNKDSTSYSTPPHTVSSDRRAAFDGVRTPHAARLRTANPGGETDQPTVDFGAKSVASPSASQRGACADRDVLNKDSTSYSTSPHTVSSDRRAAFDGVRTPHAARLRTANPGGETDQPTVDFGAKSVASPSASQRGACADRDVLNKDSTSFSTSPHTVSSDRRAAFGDVQTPHAARLRTANPCGESDQPTVGPGAKSFASPSASQRGACADRDGLKKDSTSYSTSPHTISSDRRAAFDGVRTPHAAHLRTAIPCGETDQPTVCLGDGLNSDKERRSTTVSQTYYNSVHDQFPSNSSNYEHHTVHRAPQGARAISVSASTSRQDKASHRHPKTSKQGRSQHNKVSSYFNCKSKSVQSLNTIPPVGCTVTSTNNSTSLDTVVVSDASHPDRLFSSVGHGIVDHSHDLHSGHPRHDRLPSELLAISTQDHTSDTTDNNPLDISDKILNTDHPIQASQTLRILESLADDGPDHEIDESNLMPDGGHDGVNTENLEFRDLSVDPSTTDSDAAHKSTVQHSGTNGPIRDMGVSADTRATQCDTKTSTGRQHLPRQDP